MRSVRVCVCDPWLRTLPGPFSRLFINFSYEKQQVLTSKAERCWAGCKESKSQHKHTCYTLQGFSFFCLFNQIYSTWWINKWTLVPRSVWTVFCLFVCSVCMRFQPSQLTNWSSLLNCIPRYKSRTESCLHQDSGFTIFLKKQHNLMQFCCFQIDDWSHRMWITAHSSVNYNNNLHSVASLQANEI